MINPSLLINGSLLQMALVFLLQLSCSLWPFLYLTPITVTGVGFPRLILQIIGVSYLSAILILAYNISLNSFSIFSSLIFIIPIFFWVYVYFRTQESDDERRSKWLRPLGGWLLFHLVLKLYLGASFVFSPYENGLPWKEFLFTIQSLVLGGAIYAMCLGHYYLVVPKLSNKFLLKVASLFWVLLAVRAILLVIWYFYAMPKDALQIFSLDYFHIMMVLMGIIWGWLGTSVLAIFGQKLTRMNSIQSATGIYYIVVFFVLTGFLLSNYYFCKYKILF